jgi:hypothetical protein
LKLVFKFKLITPSSSYLAYIESYERFMKSIKDNKQHIRFSKLYVEGKNTFTIIKNDIEDINQDDFNELERLINKNNFILVFFC